MLTFFRKIRWRLARDNQFFKYSRYAVGEIVLVVLGILIALYINNWNEQRKNEQITLELFREIQNDLLKNLQDLKSITVAYSDKYYWSRMVLLNQVKEIDYQEHKFDLPTLILFSWRVSFQKNGYEKLSNSVIEMPAKYKDEIDELIDLYIALDDIEKSQDRILEQTLLNREKIANNNSWYSDYPWNSQEAIKFFLNDPFYKNLVRNYEFLILDFELFLNMVEIVRTYNMLSRCTMENNLPPEYQHLLEQDLNEFVGSYQFLSSNGQSELDERVITTGERCLIYHGSYYPFYEVAKDSFVSTLNNTLIFKRDSIGKIIGASRNMVDESFELIKIN